MSANESTPISYDFLSMKKQDVAVKWWSALDSDEHKNLLTQLIIVRRRSEHGPRTKTIVS
jgi:hypothetical protein